MSTIRRCRVHGETPHGAQSRCLLCKKARSSAYRVGRATRVKICERPGCTEPAVMWLKNPRWCGHTDRVWCLYRHNKRKVST